MNIRTVVKTYLFTKRLQVNFAVLTPMFLIFESALANGWVYAGGSMDFHEPRVWVAFGRGLFFEVLTYSCAKLTKLLFARRSWAMVLITGIVALWAMLVSTGNNLGWVLSGGDLGGMLGTVGKYLPSGLDQAYQIGLGVLLPMSVGALALVDTKHLVHEALSSNEIESLSIEVAESSQHQTEMLSSIKKQRKSLRPHYDQIAQTRTQGLIDKAKGGDFTFGSDEIKKKLDTVTQKPGGARRVITQQPNKTAAALGGGLGNPPGLIAPGKPRPSLPQASLPQPGQTIIGQAVPLPPGPSTGQTINVPGQALPPMPSMPTRSNRL